MNRWVSADPLEVHTADSGDLNVYAYVKGFTLKATDPQGLKVVIHPSVKDEAKRDEILDNFQKLTRDELSLREFKGAGGKVGWEVYVSKRADGEQALSDRPLGTDLLRTLIDDKRVLEMGDGPSVRRQLGPGFFRPESGARLGVLVMDFDWLKKNSLEFVEKSDKSVSWKRAPTHIVLGHELVHAYRHLKKVSVPGSVKETELTRKGRHLALEYKSRRDELETTGTRKWSRNQSGSVRVITENLVRKEQGLRERKYYGVSRDNGGPVQYGAPHEKP